MTIKLAFQKLSDTAKMPSKPKVNSDAGFDLYSNEEVVLHPGETKVIKTGIAVQQFPPDGWNSYCKVEDTSGNAAKRGLVTKAGVIDYEYRGDIGVVMKNDNKEDFTIRQGDKIAQMIPYLIPFVEIVEWDENFTTTRNTDGYGSTGVAGK